VFSDGVTAESENKVAQLGTGTISSGGEEFFSVVLTADKPHRVFVHPDDPTVDFDLAVYDENNNLVDFDVSDSADAFCIITPKWTGTFRLQVMAARGMSSYTIVVED